MRFKNFVLYMLGLVCSFDPDSENNSLSSNKVCHNINKGK